MIRCAASGVALALTAATAANAALVISKDATSNVNCAAGVCTATAADAVLNVKDLRSILQHGPLMVVSGPDAQDIEIDQKFTWTQRHHLTLDAFRSILFREAAISEARSAVTLITNDGGSGGDYSFTGRGHISFWDTKSQLVINGQTFTLVNDIATLAGDIAANPFGAYALARGYDASVDGTYAATPVPTPLAGTLTGLGHSITNLSIHRATARLHVNTGFLAEIANTATVRDLALDTAAIAAAGRDSYVGGLAALSEGVISHVSVNGTVAGKGRSTYTAGLVAWSTGTVSDSSTSGSVTGTSNHGIASAGLVGRNEGTVTRSFSTAKVNDKYEACGLVGDNIGTVSLSFATGDASIVNQAQKDNPTAGGLVCRNTGTIDQSFATGAVSAGYGHSGEAENDYFAYGGGLAAYNNGHIENSYATGPVTALNMNYIGGLVGYSFGAIARSYSSGVVDAPPDRGGLLGHALADYTLSHTYWDTDSSGIGNLSEGVGNVANAPGVAGLSTAQFQSGLPAGLDPNIWGETAGINGGLPYLLANPPPQ